MVQNIEKEGVRVTIVTVDSNHPKDLIDADWAAIVQCEVDQMELRAYGEAANSRGFVLWFMYVSGRKSLRVNPVQLDAEGFTPDEIKSIGSVVAAKAFREGVK